MTIVLEPGQTYITEDPRDAFKVTKGSLDVFVIPFDKGVRGRPGFVITVEDGSTIPALSYKDSDYVTWMFGFGSRDGCEIQRLENGATRPLRKRFSKQIGIDDEAGPGTLEKALKEIYVSQLVRDDVLITRSEAHREEERAETKKLIEQAAEAKTKNGTPDVKDRSYGKISEKRQSRGRLRRAHFPHLIIMSLLATIAVAVLMISAGRFASPGPAFASAGGYLLLLWLGGRMERSWAEAESQEEYRRLLEELYWGSGAAHDKDTAQARALAILGTKEVIRDNVTRRLKGMRAMMTAVGVAVVGSSMFPLPVIVAVIVSALGGAMILAGNKKASYYGGKARDSARRSGAGLLEALYKIEKVRLSGAVEHITRRYYAEKLEEKQNRRAGTRATAIREVLTASVIVAGSILIVNIILRSSSDEVLQGTAIMIGCGIIMYETIVGARSFSGIRQVAEERDRCDVGTRGQKDADVAEKYKSMDEGSPVMEIDGIRFLYGDREVCSNMSFKINKGEHLGIAGPSGCGKTTLMRLITGCEEPSHGQIRFMGDSLSEGGRDALRNISSILLQNDQLFTASIIENLIAGADEADLAAVKKAVEDAGLAEEISNMPMGVDTLIREDGENISAGQKQKVLIARALTRDPLLTFWDEAESELSNREQEHIWEAIIDRNMTTVTISHQYQTLKNCDRIIVIDRGKIVETGSPEELIDNKKHFYSLMRRQL